MKKAFWLLLLPLLSGCWDVKEPERMYYILGLGIDYKDNEYEVYAQIIDFSNIAKSEQPNPEANQAEVGISKGRTVEEAYFKMYKSMDERLFWGHLSYVIFSENALKENVAKPVIEAFIRYRELRYTTWVYTTQESIEDILLLTPIINKSIALSKLSDPLNSYNQSSFIRPVNFRELTIDLDEPSHEVAIPYLKIEEKWKTEKGDDHDIGKNLVDIILSNNGYKVVDLGIKVTPATLIEAVRKENPDIIGLSGLLVKSAQQMVITAQDFKDAGIAAPILVGGAALSRRFTETKITAEYDGPVLYAKDAMQGLDLANRLQDSVERENLLAELQESIEKRSAADEARAARPVKELVEKPVRTIEDAKVFVPKDLRRHVQKEYAVSHLHPYVNMRTLIGHHLGLKGNVEKLLAEGDSRATELKELVDGYLTSGVLKPSAMYQFFPAQADGDDVVVYDPTDTTKEIERFTFPRQQVAPFLCLADFLKTVESGEMDYIGLMVVTAGHGVSATANKLKDEGKFLESHALHATALELAEGFAERIHQEMRDQWGFPDATDFTMRDRFAAKYQGQRFSFGYPACPNLEDQEKLFKVLKPEDIGVNLTEGFMMEPEASVSAIVFAHPNARYFNV